MTSISNLSSKSRAIRSFLPMCLAGLDRRSQTSHKDGKAHFENNISHKDHIQLFLTCLDTLFHVIFHLFLNHLTNIHCFTINVSAGLSRCQRQPLSSPGWGSWLVRQCFPALFFYVGLRLPVLFRVPFLLSDLACLVCTVQIKVVSLLIKTL